MGSCARLEGAILSDAPLSKVVWQRNEQVLEPQASKAAVELSCVRQTPAGAEYMAALSILNCTTSDAGKYTCVAVNAFGHKSSNCQLRIEIEPSGTSIYIYM